MGRRRIKIFFLIDALNPGGTEGQLILLAEGLPREYFEPVIGVLRKSDYQDKLNLKTPIVDFNCSGLPMVRTLFLLYKLQRYLYGERFDIIQTQFIDSTILGAFAARLDRSRSYLITTRRNLYHWLIKKTWSFRLLRLTVNWTDCILVNSQSVFNECQRMESIPTEKITLIPNTVEVERFNSISSENGKKSIGISGEFPVIGVLSIWRPVKGLLTFLNAAVRVLSEISSAYFVLAGEGSQEKELKSYVRNLGIQDRVLFIRDPSDIPVTIAAFDVAVQPSLSESFSNVLIEYMAAGKPIVATRVGDAENVIKNGREGILVQPNNPNELSDAIIYLCHNQDKSANMGRLAREKVVANWASDKILNEYCRFYEEIAKDINE